MHDRPGNPHACDEGRFKARGEEPADPAPVRVGAGFRASMSYTVTGVRVLTA